MQLAHGNTDANAVVLRSCSSGATNEAITARRLLQSDGHEDVGVMEGARRAVTEQGCDATGASVGRKPLHARIGNRDPSCCALGFDC